MKNRMLKTVYLLTPLVVLMSGATVSSGPAMAQAAERSPVTLTSDVKIERVETGPTGAEQVKLFGPGEIAVVPGDKVLFTLIVSNSGKEPASGFRAVNPLPNAVRFTSVAEDWAELSVDGGANWGKLADLKVKAKDASGTTDVERAATPDDVTHVRWVFPDSIAAGAKRSISYRGVVK